MLVYEFARKRAAELRSGYKKDQALSMEDLIEIAELFEASVIFRGLSDSASGLVVQEKGAPPFIYINRNEPKTRQLFTLAHEIGHLVDRAESKDTDYSFIDYRTSQNYDLHEFFADEFAGALLMPAEKLRSLVGVEGEKGLIPAAQYFGVSIPAVERRLARLDKHS